MAHQLYHERPRGSEIWAWLVNIVVMFAGPSLIWYFGNAFLTRYEGNKFGMLMTSIIMFGLFVLYIWFCWELFFGKNTKKEGAEKRGFFSPNANERFIVLHRLTKSARVAPDRLTASTPGIEQVEKDPVKMGLFTVVVKDEIPFDFGPPVKAEAQIILRIGPSDDEILRSRNLGTDRKALIEKLEREGSEVLNIAVRIAASTYGRDKLFMVQPMVSSFFHATIRDYKTMRIHGLVVENGTVNELNDVQKVSDLKTGEAQMKILGESADKLSALIKEKGIDPNLIDTLGSMLDPQGDISKRITDIEGTTSVRDKIAARQMTIAGLLGHPERDTPNQ